MREPLLVVSCRKTIDIAKLCNSIAAASTLRAGPQRPPTESSGEPLAQSCEPSRRDVRTGAAFCARLVSG